MIKQQFIFIFQIIFYSVLPLSFIVCQEIKPTGDERILISYCHADQQWLDVDYNYKSSLLKTTYLREITSGSKIALSLFLQPIIGISTCIKDRVSTLWEKGYEIGLGAGGRIDVNLYHSDLLWVFKLQSGPHYISRAPSRQLPGFLFSSEANTGFSLLLKGATKIEVLLGFRHLSNAEVRLPNGGLNNLLMSVGMSFEI